MQLYRLISPWLEGVDDTELNKMRGKAKSGLGQSLPKWVSRATSAFPLISTAEADMARSKKCHQWTIGRPRSIRDVGCGGSTRGPLDRARFASCYFANGIYCWYSFGTDLR